MTIDHTKWDTGQVLAHGVLNRPIPKSSLPADAKLTSVQEEDFNEKKARDGLLAGGLHAAMYYGCWSIWKDGDRYSGELMQYRNVTDRLEQASLDEAVEKAEEWFSVSYG